MAGGTDSVVLPAKKPTAEKADGAELIAEDQGKGLAEGKRGDVVASAYGPGATSDGSKVPLKMTAELGKLEIVGNPNASVKTDDAGKKTLPPKFEAAVDAIEAAANGGLTGIGTDVSKLWDTLAPLNAEEYAQVNERFAAKFGVNYASRGEKWDIKSELKDELSADDLKRFDHMIADKNVNDVPPQFRTTGDSLLKPGGELKVGEMNRMTLADGRDYDVYVPRNADSRAPVVVAMAGAGAGDMKGVFAAESGLAIEAEKNGSIVVFAYPKEREFDTKLGATKGVAWNMPDRTNLSTQVDKANDDRVYMDNVLADLSKLVQTADKVGMMGFSDGGRFAQAYAADRPGKVAGVVSMSGTWMEGDRKPTEAVPMMIIHGDSDETLPYGGGFGSTSSKMDWVTPTNLGKSQPFMQAKIWSQAAGGDGSITSRSSDGNVEERTYNAGSGEVREYILKGGQHGVHDYKNNGSRFSQWLLGEPDMRQDMVTKGAGFLKGKILRDVAS
ncbi:MAG: dienelactone hydrolase family protein [Leptolyngbya sp.]|nr:dienelactone hydrolase family protein [Candidatus Melainabacteria bacterium]